LDSLQRNGQKLQQLKTETTLKNTVYILDIECLVVVSALLLGLIIHAILS
jgi:hypothetical protein